MLLGKCRTYQPSSGWIFQYWEVALALLHLYLRPLGGAREQVTLRSTSPQLNHSAHYGTSEGSHIRKKGVILKQAKHRVGYGKLDKTGGWEAAIFFRYRIKILRPRSHHMEGLPVPPLCSLKQAYFTHPHHPWTMVISWGLPNTGPGELKDLLSLHSWFCSPTECAGSPQY